jgi:hypothetical protein
VTADRRQFPMVGECAEEYHVEELADGGAEIRIRVSPRFKDLWMVKLSELQASQAEIDEWAPLPPGAERFKRSVRDIEEER